MTAAKPPAKKAAAKKAPARKRPKKADEIPVVPGVTPLSKLKGGGGPGDVPVSPEEWGVDAELEPIATFTAYSPRCATNDNGELTITLRADGSQKYNAMPVTDHTDKTLFIKAFVVRRGNH